MDDSRLLAAAMLLFGIGIALTAMTPFVLIAPLAMAQFVIGVGMAVSGVVLYAVYAIRVLYASMAVEQLPIDATGERAG